MRQIVKIASVLSVALWITGCDQKPEGSGAAAGPQSVPVNVIKVTTQPQEITLELPGRSRAYLEAEVRPQVSGIVLARSFNEGERSRKASLFIKLMRRSMKLR